MYYFWDFPDGPAVKTLLPMQAAQVRSLVREPRFHEQLGVGDGGGVGRRAEDSVS